jgi:hypothetical protein
MADNDSIGDLLRAETARRHYSPGVRVREDKNGELEVSFVGDVVTMDGRKARNLWEWLRLQPDDLTGAEFMAHTRGLLGRDAVG